MLIHIGVMVIILKFESRSSVVTESKKL